MRNICGKFTAHFFRLFLCRNVNDNADNAVLLVIRIHRVCNNLEHPAVYRHIAALSLALKRTVNTVNNRFVAGIGKQAFSCHISLVCTDKLCGRIVAHQHIFIHINQNKSLGHILNQRVNLILFKLELAHLLADFLLLIVDCFGKRNKLLVGSIFKIFRHFFNRLNNLSRCTP